MLDQKVTNIYLILHGTSHAIFLINFYALVRPCVGRGGGDLSHRLDRKSVDVTN